MNINLLALIYFIAGAAGTFSRVWLSPVMELGWNRQAIVQVVSGGIAGFTLPYLFLPAIAKMVGIPDDTLAGSPIVVKAGIIFLLSGSGSFAVGELLAKFGKGSPSEKKP